MKVFVALHPYAIRWGIDAKPDTLESWAGFQPARIDGPIVVDEAACPKRIE